MRDLIFGALLLAAVVGSVVALAYSVEWLALTLVWVALACWVGGDQ